MTRAPVPRNAAQHNGFTLIEMLIALAIFALLAGGALSLLSFSVDAEAASRQKTEDIAKNRRFLAVWTADLAQAVPRPYRDTAGDRHAAFEAPGGGTLLRITRGGWSNYDGAARPGIQRVEYRWQGSKVIRIGLPFPDGARGDEGAAVADAAGAPVLRFRTSDGVWRDRWEPQRTTELPVAIELTLPQPGGEPLVVVSLVGANYQ